MGVPASYGVAASGESPYARDAANAVIQGTLAAVRATKAFAFNGPMNLWLWASLNVTLTTTAGSLTGVVSAAGALAAGTAVKSTLVPPGTTMSGIGGTNITLVLPIYSFNCTVKAGVAKLYDIPDTTWLLGATVSGTGVSGTVTAIDTPAVNGAGGVVSISAAATAAPTRNDKVPIDFTLALNCIAAGVDTAATFTGLAIVFNANILLERSFDGGSTFLPCNIGGSGAPAQWTGATLGPVSLSFGEPEGLVLYRLNALAYTGITSTTLNYRISETGQAAKTLSVPTLS